MKQPRPITAQRFTPRVLLVLAARVRRVDYCREPRGRPAALGMMASAGAQMVFCVKVV